MKRPIPALWCLIPVLLACSLHATAQQADPGPQHPAPVDFARQIRPILADHCFACHGPDEATREADLRLDHIGEFIREKGEDIIIRPGHPSDSLLVQRVTASNEDDRMPPVEEDNALTKKEIALLVRWIKEGAKWNRHWAFDPPKSTAPPEVSDKAWSKTQVDRFLRARMEDAGLKPSPPADRDVWLRRVAFDLTGLPPTLDELEAFGKDTSKNAKQKVVDRLLASPRFGERRAADWLDLARYADSNGYQRDGERSIWPWRDWVIRAFNANMPYDRFILDQLAGDLLPHPTLDQRIATGFNRNHAVNSEAGEEKDEYRISYVMDRVRTTATTFLGLTLACAQCHDHKFDPLSQEDYYKFFAFFNNIEEGARSRRRSTLPVPDKDKAPLLADLTRRIKTLESRLDGDDPVLDRAESEWVDRIRAEFEKPTSWEVLEPHGLMALNGSKLVELEDKSILSKGDTPVRDTYELVFKPGKRKITALKLEVLPDPIQPGGGSGRGKDGRFILSQLKVRVATLSDAQDPPLVHVVKAEADINQEAPQERFSFSESPGNVADSIVIDDSSQSSGRGFGGGWSLIGEARKEPHEAVILPIEPLDLNNVSILRISLVHTSRPYKTLVGRFRISCTSDESIRHRLLPVAPGLWKSVGPFPAKDLTAAYSTRFEPEKQISTGLDLKKKYMQPVLPPAPSKSSKNPSASSTMPGPSKGKGATAAKKGSPISGKKKEFSKVKGRKKAKQSGPPTAATGKKRAAAPPSNPKTNPKPEPTAKPSKDNVAGTPNKKSGSTRKRKPQPVELAWKEQRTWSDGKRGSVAGENDFAWYFHRSLTTRRPRTATIQLSGAAGWKVWLNGKLIFEKAPTPSSSSTSRSPGPPSFGFGRSSRRSSGTEVHLGLRKGTNQLVVKGAYHQRPPRRRRGPSKSTFDPRLVGMGGGQRFRRRSGASFTFRLTPEGEDVVTYEVVKALQSNSMLTSLAHTKTTNEGEQPAAARSAGTPRPTESARAAKVLRKHFRRMIDPAGRLMAKELKRLEEEKRTLTSKMPQTLVMRERDKPRKTYVLVRGDFRHPGREVHAGVPSVLPPLAPDLPKNRLGLAKWLVSDDNPLTARVMVNRIWKDLFGIGLVETAGDFGTRGGIPLHQDLLDWLAVDFRTHGWDIKRIYRMLALTTAYGQTSRATEESISKDPANHHFARGPQRRLTAEMIRDQALSVSGLLVQKLGGESVKPRQPEGLWSVIGNGSRYRRDKGPAQYRRSLYIFWKRGAPYPSLITFDASKREVCTVDRAETTTPNQALVLLNDPVFVEAARMLAQRLLQLPLEEARDRLRTGYRLCTSREPTKEELNLLARHLEAQTKYYGAHEDEARKLLGVGDAKPDPKIDAGRLAAWTTTAQALLNIEATLTRN